MSALAELDALIAEFAPLRTRLMDVLRAIEAADPRDSKAAGARAQAADLGHRLDHVRNRLAKQTAKETTP